MTVDVRLGEGGVLFRSSVGPSMILDRSVLFSAIVVGMSSSVSLNWSVALVGGSSRGVSLSSSRSLSES